MSPVQSAHFVVGFVASSFLLNNPNPLTPWDSRVTQVAAFVLTLCSSVRRFYRKGETSAFDAKALCFLSAGFPHCNYCTGADTHKTEATTTLKEQTERLVHTDGPQVTR